MPLGDGRRFSEGTSADREIQRTLMELLNQMDGFDRLGQVKMIMATNRPDVLDPALLQPGRLDRKIGRIIHVRNQLRWSRMHMYMYSVAVYVHIFCVYKTTYNLYMYVHISDQLQTILLFVKSIPSVPLCNVLCQISMEVILLPSYIYVLTRALPVTVHEIT